MAEFGRQAQEGNELTYAHAGLRVLQEAVQGLMAELVELLKALPLQLAHGFQPKGPELLGCYALGFYCRQGGIGRVQPLGGGAPLPTVTGTELADDSRLRPSF